MAMELYEILVPTVRNDGRPIRTRYHKVWDKMVYSITSGVTILKPVKGKWVSPSSKLYEERMIPVRIACTPEQYKEILKMTLKYYEQEVIMGYKVATEVEFYKE